MRIAKSAKRLLSALTVTTLLVSGIVVAPKAVKAAEGDVNMLGTTLRVSGNAADTQSIRVGIQIKNASQKKACGVTISYNGKEKIVSTETGATKVYSKNDSDDSIIYSVVITGIPKDKFEDSFTFTGDATPIEGEKIATTSLEKSVNDIASTITSISDDYEMLENGVLAKKVDSLDIEDMSKSPRFKHANSTGEYDTTLQSRKITTTGANGGINWKAEPIGSVAGDGTYYFQAKLKADADCKATFYRFANEDPLSVQKDLVYGADFTTIIASRVEAASNFPTFQLYTTLPAESTYYIKSFDVYKALEDEDMPNILPMISIPLSGADFDGSDKGKPCGVYENNTLKIDDNRTDGSTTVIYLPLPEGVEIKAGQKVKVTISGSQWGTDDFRIWTTPNDKNARTSGNYVTNNGIYLKPIVKKDKSFTGSVELEAKDATCGNLTLKPVNGTKIKGLTISEVKIFILG